jgi:putative sigma-54 modulation protein
MRVLIKGVHLELSDAYRQRVEERLVAPLARVVGNPAELLELHVVDNNGPKGGEDKEVRATLHLPGTRAIHVEQAAADAYTALDLLKTRLERAVKRELERMREPARGIPGEPFGTPE